MDASQSKLEVFLFITTLLGFIYPIVSSPRGAVYLLSNVKVLNTLYLYWRPLPTHFLLTAQLLTALNSGSMFEAVTLQDKWLVSSRPGHEAP